MKRTLSFIAALLLLLSLAACGRQPISSGFDAAQSGSASAVVTAVPQQDATETAAPAETPAPTDTPAPTATPAPTVPPISQDVELNQVLLSKDGITVKLVRLTYKRNYEAEMTFEVENCRDFLCDVYIWLNSANCWGLYEATETYPDEEYDRYTAIKTVNNNVTETVTYTYYLRDPAVPRMQIEQIDHCSLDVLIRNNETNDTIGQDLVYVEVTGAPEPDFQNPAGTTLYEDAKLTATWLDFDKSSNTGYLYLAYPNTTSGGYLEVYPLIGGFASSKDSWYLNTDYNKQAILALDLSDMMERLGVNGVSLLSLGLILAPSQLKPLILDVPLRSGVAAEAVVCGDEITRTNDILACFDGIETVDGTQYLVFDIENLSQSETFLISIDSDSVTLDGAACNTYGYATLLPGTNTKFRTELCTDDWDDLAWTSGSLSFRFDYSPFKLGTTYYSGARYSDMVTLAHP